VFSHSGVPERLHAATLQPPADSPLDSFQRESYGCVQRCISFLNDNARQTPKHHLHAAHTIDATARAVHILHAKTDALD
jgi:hypothetical protein